jgi:hypothetical protein
MPARGHWVLRAVPTSSGVLVSWISADQPSSASLPLTRPVAHLHHPVLAAVTKPAPDGRRCLVRHDTFARACLVAIVNKADPPARCQGHPDHRPEVGEPAGGTWVSQKAKNTVSKRRGGRQANTSARMNSTGNPRTRRRARASTSGAASTATPHAVTWRWIGRLLVLAGRARPFGLSTVQLAASMCWMTSRVSSGTSGGGCSWPTPSHRTSVAVGMPVARTSAWS